MPASKGGNGATVRETPGTLLDFEEEAPESRQGQGRTAGPLDAALVAAILRTFTEGKAVVPKSRFSTLTEARKAAATLLRHAHAAADQMDPPKSARSFVKTAAGAVSTAETKDGDGPFSIKVQQTHKRAEKAEEASPAAK